MREQLILEIFNRKPVTEIQSRHEEEGKDFILADGEIKQIIGIRR